MEDMKEIELECLGRLRKSIEGLGDSIQETCGVFEELHKIADLLKNRLRELKVLRIKRYTLGLTNSEYRRLKQ